MEFKKGEFVILTKGSYSDYGIQGLFVSTQDWAEEEAFARWRDTAPLTGEKWWVEPEDFSDDEEFAIIAYRNRVPYDVWLVLHSGYLQEVEYSEMNTDYDPDGSEIPWTIRYERFGVRELFRGEGERGGRLPLELLDKAAPLLDGAGRNREPGEEPNS